MLIEAATALVAGKGAETLFLEVAEDNARGPGAFYAKTGFTETGRRQRYYSRDDGPPADALILSRARARRKNRQSPEKLTLGQP